MRILLLIIAVLFAGLIGWAVSTGGFLEAGGWLTGNAWGIVTLSDLYIGLAVAAVLIALFERSPVVAALWIVPLPFLGNLWTLVWLAVRWPALKARLSR